MESNQNDLAEEIKALQQKLAELEAQQQASQIDTGGGAAVANSVKVRGGHFIGRDFIQTVNHITHTDEDPEEVKSIIALYLHALSLDLAGLNRLSDLSSADTKPAKSWLPPTGEY